MAPNGKYVHGKNTVDYLFPRLHHPLMTAIQMPTPETILKAAEAKGLTLASLCRRADLDTATFYRWKSGKGTPTLGTIQKMLDAIEREVPGS